MFKFPARANVMKPETATLLKEMEHEFFESDEYVPIRASLFNTPKDDDEPEELDVVFDLIDEYAPTMHNFINSFL